MPYKNNPLLENKRTTLKNAQYYLNNLEDQSSFWKDIMRKDLGKNLDLAVSLFQQQYNNSQKEVLFFNDYIFPFSKTSYSYRQINWFISYTSNDWLLNNINECHSPKVIAYDGIFLSIFQSIINNYTSPSYEIIKLSFVKKIELLSEEQTDIFFKNHISILSSDQIFYFLRMISSYGNCQLITQCHSLYMSQMNYEKQCDIGWNMFLHQKGDFVIQFSQLIITGLLPHLSSRNDAINSGRTMTNTKLKLYYDYYETLPPEHRDNFSHDFIYQNLLSKEKSDFIKAILKIKEHKPSVISKEIYIFLIWKISHIYPKDEAQKIMQDIYYCAEKTGDLVWLKDNISSNNTICFNQNPMDLSNSHFQQFLKLHLFFLLSSSLLEKNYNSIKIKI